MSLYAQGLGRTGDAQEQKVEDEEAFQEDVVAVETHVVCLRTTESCMEINVQGGHESFIDSGGH